MSGIKEFEVTVKEEIKHYKQYYKSSLKSKTKLVDIIANFVHYRNHNSLLPTITLLSAKVSGKITDNTYVAASIIDHLYTATLIHDDVEDESYGSKGFMKINALWKEKLSVLMGDYFLAKGLLLSVKNKTYDLLEIVSKSVKQITEGELRMIHITKNLLISKEEYFGIIDQKSASLYSACTVVGAISGGADEEAINILSSFGRNYGIALFIRNDLSIQHTITNSRYRITLPLILALQNSDEAEKNKILNYLQYPVTKELTQYLQTFTETNGGVENSIRMMEDYKVKALNDITEFKYSESIEALKQLVNSTV